MASQEHEEAKKQALKNFQKQYPNTTSADLQAFVLGMQAMEKIIYGEPEKDYLEECIQQTR